MVGGPQVTIRADGDQLDQLLINLVENAAQATAGAGQVDITVSAGQVQVRDDGPGVPDDIAHKVFQPFFTTKTQGTGLGLAICRRNAQSMGGDLSLDHTGPGALFTLSEDVTGTWNLDTGDGALALKPEQLGPERHPEPRLGAALHRRLLRTRSPS